MPTKKRAKYPDHTSELARLKKIQGQLSGVMKMIAEKRYCVDILVQCRAIASGMSAVELIVLERHARHCIRKAVSSDNPKDGDEKINELVMLLSKRLRGP